MKLVITDANIIIDMAAGELLQTMFALEMEFSVPNVLYVEELERNYSVLPAYGLKVANLSSEMVAESLRLRGRYPGPGQNDLFALALAKTEGCTLLTGDAALRQAAREENVEVHGTLWLVEQLVEQLGLPAKRAELAYEKMREDGSRLPWVEIKAQLRRLSR